MGYANPIEAMGYAAFAERPRRQAWTACWWSTIRPRKAAQTGRLAQATRHRQHFSAVADFAKMQRMAKVGRVASGYIYYVSLKGVTGASHLDLQDIGAENPAAALAHQAADRRRLRHPRRRRPRAPSPRLSDAVVIGSRLVQEIETSAPEPCLANVKALVSGIRKAIDE